MIRSASLVLALSLLTAVPAAATRLEVHTDVTRATVAIQNERFAYSSPPPFATDLPAGRYDLSITANGRRVGGYLVDIDGGVHLRGGRWTRLTYSAVLPGSGQWRDDSWWSGLTTGGSVALLVGRAVYFNVKSGSKKDEADVSGVPLSDELRRLAYDADVLEKTRDDYLLLSGIFYAGNVLDAAVRRGAMSFRETSPGVIRASYEPTGVLQSMGLSALWPGLGQVRQGNVGRARVWNGLMLGAAYFWAEAQNLVEEAKADRDFYDASHTAADDGYYETMARLGSDIDEQKAVARSAVYVAAALWAYNIADAGLVTRQAATDSGEMVRSDGEPRSWSVTPGLVGQGAGLVLGWKF